MSWKNRSLRNLGFIATLTWSDWWKPWKATVSLVGVPSGIQTKHFTNTSLGRHRCANLLGRTHSLIHKDKMENIFEIQTEEGDLMIVQNFLFEMSAFQRRSYGPFQAQLCTWYRYHVPLVLDRINGCEGMGYNRVGRETNTLRAVGPKD
jgi:hypothetical protein